MASTAEGITVGDDKGLDPNDPTDFAAIMEGRGVEKTDEDTDVSDTSIASGLTYGEEPGTPPRGPDGKFVAKEAAAAPEDTPTGGATDTSDTDDGAADDPEIAAILAKYDGDPEKALKALANAQSLIGRRDEDRDRLERELAEVRGRLDGFIAAGAHTSAAAPMSNEQVVEVATSRIESVGYDAAAQEAANHAHKSGDERAYQAIMEQWMIESPVAAMDFNTDFRLWQREQRTAAESSTTPAWALRAEEQAKVETYGEGFKALRTELGPETFKVVAEQFDAALEQMPQNVLQMIDSDDSEARDAGFKIVADRALRLAAASGARPAADPTPTPEQLAARKLAGARVASGALRPAEKRTGDASPDDVKAAITEFKRQIVEAPTTNIASGLTYGPQP